MGSFLIALGSLTHPHSFSMRPMFQQLLHRAVFSMARCWDPEHRSLTRDRAFDECQYRYKAVYRDGTVRDGVGAPAVVGLAVDSYLTDALMGLRPKSVEDYLSETAAEVASPTAELDWKAMTTKATALVRLGMDEVVPTYEGRVAYTQLELHFNVPGIEATFHSHLDLMLDDGSIIDWKTSERRLGADRAIGDVQLTRYALAVYLSKDFGFLPPAVGLDGLIYANPPRDVLERNPGATKPWYDKQRSTRTVEQLQAHMAEMRDREKARELAEAHNLWRTTGRASLMACSFCPVKPVCPAWTPYETREAHDDQ